MARLDWLPAGPQKHEEETMFYLAGKAFFLHTLLTILGISWSLLINQPILSAGFGLLWLICLVIYLEFRNSV